MYTYTHITSPHITRKFGTAHKIVFIHTLHAFSHSRTFVTARYIALRHCTLPYIEYIHAFHKNICTCIHTYINLHYIRNIRVCKHYTGSHTVHTYMKSYVHTCITLQYGTYKNDISTEICASHTHMHEHIHYITSYHITLHHITRQLHTYILDILHTHTYTHTFQYLTCYTIHMNGRTYTHAFIHLIHTLTRSLNLILRTYTHYTPPTYSHSPYITLLILTLPCAIKRITSHCNALHIDPFITLKCFSSQHGSLHAISVGYMNCAQTLHTCAQYIHTHIPYIPSHFITAYNRLLHTCTKHITYIHTVHTYNSIFCYHINATLIHMHACITSPHSLHT